MKILPAYILLLISACSSNDSNDFSNTELKLLTDKEIYNSNDSIEITVLITPKGGDKKIRILKNLNNITISFRAKGKQLGLEQEANRKFIEFVNNSTEEKQYINEVAISKTNPFKKVFKGRVFERNNNIFFEIPELGINKSFLKSELIKNPIIILEGSCYTINSGIEESFSPKEFQLKID